MRKSTGGRYWESVYTPERERDGEGEWNGAGKAEVGNNV
jgi:hypothetical protein